MDRLIAVATIVAMIAAWNLFLYRKSGGRMWTPLWLAFSSTAGALFFLAAGVLGYRLDRHQQFVTGTAWAGEIVWSEIAVALVLAIIAVPSWRRAFNARPVA